MAKITFFATADDFDAIWSVIFIELGLIAYPDPWFGKLPAPALTTPADVSANLIAYPRIAPGLSYFLVSPRWSTERLKYCVCDDNPHFAPFGQVSQRYGGPSIHFIPSFGYPWHNEPHQIISGMFSDYAHYYSVNDNRQIIERPAALVATMKTIRQMLRSLGKTVRSSSGQRAIALRRSLIAQSAGVVLRSGSIVYSPLASSRSTKHP